MAAKGDEEFDSLLSSFDEIYDEFKNGITKIQNLQSSYNSEIQKREALQFTANCLKSENERLMKLYTDSINKLADQLERQSNCQSLKEELKRASDEHIRKESKLGDAMNLLKQDYENKIRDLETKIRDFLVQKTENELTIIQLRQDLAVHRNHVDALASRLDRVHSDVESTHKYEIQDLKDCLMIELEEKNELNRKLQSLEKELLISRTKLVENQQDLTSNRQVDTLKQKVMKLRKENEVLKRQLLDSKLE